MRAVWVDAGNDPNWDLLKKHGITWVFVGLDEPDADIVRRVNDIKRRGLVPGIHAAWSWFPGLSGAQFADAVHLRIKALFPNATNTSPRVQINDETHDPARIEQMLRRWRRLRPFTATSWTLEGMQGGWATHPPLVKAVTECRVRVVPQCYTGPMIPRDPVAVCRDLTADHPNKYPAALVTPMLDAAVVSPTVPWRGWAFTMGRLK